MKSFLQFKSSYIVRILLLLLLSTFSAYGQSGNYLNFDGTNDYVNLSSSINLSGGSFTLEAWFNTSINPGNSFTKKFIVSVGGDGGPSYYHTFLFLTGNGSGQAKIQTGYYGEDLIYNWTYDANWHHIAFTFDNSNKEGILYLNGSNVASKTFASGLIGSGRATIGTPTWNLGYEVFNANIDEVRIWNVNRSSTNIANNYNNFSLNPSTSGLVAYYQFNQGAAGGDNTGVTTLNDATSNNYHGTLTNFALNGSSSNWLNLTPLPVELNSFTARIIEEKIELNWQTATEVNNFGFEIERASSLNTPGQGGHTDWENIGFVNGHGNSNSVKEYSFTDNLDHDRNHNHNPTLYYRLKQIDNDGGFEYLDVVEVAVNNLSTQFSLEQNYPNPFNPETMIEFTLPENGIASLKMYNILGEEVAELFNEFAEAGKYHQVRFNASTLVSGIYIARLQFSGKQMMKKMLYLK